MTAHGPRGEFTPPLITPERLKRDRGEALAKVPRWADAFGLDGGGEDGIGLEDAKVVVGIASAREEPPLPNH
jgi:hypothetical protein